MASEEEKAKKKPKVKYEKLFDDNVIVAEVKDTKFIFWRTQTHSKKKGGFKIFQGGAEAEAERKDEWTGIVWEPDIGIMPRSVWDEKRRKEILENMRDTISTATGVKDFRMSGSTGTLLTFQPMTERCPHCESPIPTSSIFCPICGKKLDGKKGKDTFFLG